MIGHRPIIRIVTASRPTALASWQALSSRAVSLPGRAASVLLATLNLTSESHFSIENATGAPMSTSLLLTMRVMLCALGLREAANPGQRANGLSERASGLQLGRHVSLEVSRLRCLRCGNDAPVSVRWSLPCASQNRRLARRPAFRTTWPLPLLLTSFCPRRRARIDQPREAKAGWVIE